MMLLNDSESGSTLPTGLTTDSALRRDVAESTRSLDGPPPDLFPLPLTAFEKLMVSDDHRQYPRVYTVTLEFDGNLNRTAIGQALSIVVKRNPLLSATIKKTKTGWSWWPIQFSNEYVRWDDAERAFEHSTIDLRTTSGFRFYGKTDGAKSEFYLTFHHAVCDGQGARRVIIDLLTIYASITSPAGRHRKLDRLDYSRLRDRGLLPVATTESSKVSSEPNIAPSLPQRIRTVYEFLKQHPVPVRSCAKGIASSQAITNQFVTRHFEPAEVNHFRDVSMAGGLSLNEVAVGLLLNTIARWNRQHGETGKDCLYRILIPVDLRSKDDARLPAANRMSFVFITRPTTLCLDLTRLLPTIRAEMDYIKEHGSQYNLINALPVIQSIPGVVQLLGDVPVCFSTAILTNLGDVIGRYRRGFPEENGQEVVGNLRFIRGGGPPPLRRNTRVGIGITFSHGEMMIQGQFDWRHFNSSDAEGFVNLFESAWKSWAASVAHP